MAIVPASKSLIVCDYHIGYEDGIVPVLAVPEREVPNGVRLG